MLLSDMSAHLLLCGGRLRHWIVVCRHSTFVAQLSVDKAEDSRNMAMRPQQQQEEVERTARVRQVAGEVSQLARDVDRPNEV